jgi:hypothetical protein
MPDLANACHARIWRTFADSRNPGSGIVLNQTEVCFAAGKVLCECLVDGPGRT